MARPNVYLLPFLTVHYLTYVFIPKDTDITDAVTAAMRPYGDGFEVKPWKRHLDTTEIAAMAKCYRLRRTAVRKLAEQMEDWNGGRGGIDDRGLYAVLSYNRDTKWDWYEIGGRWDGFLSDNRMIASSLRRSPLLKKLLPHDFLTPDGVWHARARIATGAWPPRVIEKSGRRWLREFAAALETHAGCRVVCVDRHL